jgi:uncharacterized phage protein gp47/JayE
MTDNQIAARDAALAALPEEYDTNEGSVFWNIVSALAIPCGEIMDMLDDAIEQKDPINLEADELDAFVSQFGLTRHTGAASTAVLTIKLEETVPSVDIPSGTLFETESGLQFAAAYDFTDVQDGEAITVASLENGTICNAEADTITVVPIAIDGVEAVTNPTAAAGGMDAESDGELFDRWSIQVGYIQTGYNKAWYEAKALDMDAVGYAKAYAAGEAVGSDTVPANTVLLVVLDDDNQPLDDTTLAAVQQEIDPDAGGIGAGIAPPTACVEVVSGETVEIRIAIETLAIDSAVSAQSAKEAIEDLLQQAIGGMSPGSTVYYSQVIANIIVAEGVTDIGGVTINDAAESVALAFNQVPQLTEVTYGTVAAV